MHASRYKLGFIIVSWMEKKVKAISLDEEHLIFLPGIISKSSVAQKKI